MVPDPRDNDHPDQRHMDAFRPVGGDLPIPTSMHGTGGGQSPGKEQQGPGGRGGEEAPVLDARVAKPGDYLVRWPHPLS